MFNSIAQWREGSLDSGPRGALVTSRPCPFSLTFPISHAILKTTWILRNQWGTEARASPKFCPARHALYPAVGAYNFPPDSLAGFKGPTSTAVEEKGVSELLLTAHQHKIGYSLFCADVPILFQYRHIGFTSANITVLGQCWCDSVS